MIKVAKPDMGKIRLMLITDDKRSNNRPVEEVVKAAVAGGVRCVQFRPWKPSDAEYLEKARALRKITRAAGALLILNDRIDIASLCRADGVHLGAGDIPIRDARVLMGDTGVIGYSAHSLEEARKAEMQGADYVTFSPVFPTTSTSLPRPVTGPFTALETDCELSIPMFALGGVNHENIVELLDLGMNHAAVVSCITAAPDVEAAARSLCAIIENETLSS
jgi:thiamine-phosphate pyrophosphorylase